MGFAGLRSVCDQRAVAHQLDDTSVMLTDLRLDESWRSALRRACVPCSLVAINGGEWYLLRPEGDKVEQD